MKKILLSLIGGILAMIEFIDLIRGIVLDIRTHDSSMMWTSFVLLIVTGLVWIVLYKVFDRTEN